MDQATVGSIIQVVLQTLVSASFHEIKLIFGFKNDLEKLENSLIMIQHLLYDAEIKQANSTTFQCWLEKLEEVAFEADAVLDECNYQLLRQKVKKQKQASNKVLKFLPSVSKNLCFRINMAHKIDQVNNSLDAIYKEAQSFGLQMIAMGYDHASSSVGIDFPPTDSLSVESHIVGRDNDESKIVEMLLSAPKDETISVLPILGMGGLGKTTLARKVFHNANISAHFKKRIWVCVSSNFDATTLFKMILESLSRENVQVILTKEVVLETIREHLASKRYFLVLDDVWNENSKQWDDFMLSLTRISHVMGNCIVVTTRKENVALLVGTLPMHKPQILSDDDCCTIINEKAFRGVGIPTEFKEIGQCIGQRCSGMPLVATVIGGLLCGKSKSEWQSILGDLVLKFGPDDDTVMNILKLSYNRLPSSTIKKCFAYCSIFPQDYIIRRREVIELWMAEGYLQASRGKDMERVGDEIFKSLLQNSLFQDAYLDEYDNITYCRMHDIVHDLACLVSGSRTSTMENSKSDGLNRSRRIAIKTTREESFAMLKQHTKFLRTILSEGIFVHMIMRFKKLHVLKIWDWSVEELPDEIRELILLRFLDISKTRIRYLPDSIGKLYNLQTLLTPMPLSSLPKTIVDLISLRHLYICFGVELPPWMGKLTCLRTLQHYKVGHQQGCGIGELGKLNNLRGFLEIHDLEKVKHREEAQHANLSGKSNIFGLVFEWNQFREGDEDVSGAMEHIWAHHDEDVLDGFQPHPSLKSLEIRGYRGRTFPQWTIKMEAHNDQGRWQVLGNLMRMTITCCVGCEEVPMLGHLPQLKFLTLSHLRKLKTIGRSFYGNDNTSSMIGEPKVVFPALKKLDLHDMAELSEWVEVEGEITVFPCLKYLDIQHCPKLNSLPSHFSRLEHLTIKSCPKLKSVPSRLLYLEELKVHMVDSDFPLVDVCSNTSSLHAIDIKSLSELSSLPEELFAKNHNLRNVSIASCPNLTCLVLCSLGSGVSSIEELKISSCPEIESIPSVKCLPSLRKLEIRWCGKLRELPLDLNALHSLEELYINGCPNLKSIISNVRRGGGGNSSQGQAMFTTSLRVLSIIDCPGLSDLPTELFESCSSSLQKLVLKEIPVFPVTEICLLRSLEYMEIGGFSDSISLVELLNAISLAYLTALRCLHLNDFGRIEVLPEWIGNLSSLQELGVTNCEMLRLLPSKKAMTGLTKLEYLRIRQCPLLVERCRNQQSTSTTPAHSSEWAKISHIKHVDINCKSVWQDAPDRSYCHDIAFTFI